MAGLGVATLAIGALFAVLAHEDMRQVDRWERPMVRNAERAGDAQRAESLELVFDAERDKLRVERRTWIWVVVGGGAGCAVGLGVAWLGVRRAGLRRDM